MSKTKLKHNGATPKKNGMANYIVYLMVKIIIKGFVRTGDIGIIRPNGSVKLIDRRKNLFKLC